MINSSDPSISFQAAHSLLQLTHILSSKPNSGGLRAVAGVASSWGPVAVAALLQLWDRQLSFAGHAQIMVVITEHLSCLQVHMANCVANLLAMANLLPHLNVTCVACLAVISCARHTWFVRTMHCPCANPPHVGTAKLHCECDCSSCCCLGACPALPGEGADAAHSNTAKCPGQDGCSGACLACRGSGRPGHQEGCAQR